MSWIEVLIFGYLFEIYNFLQVGFELYGGVIVSLVFFDQDGVGYREQFY